MDRIEQCPKCDSTLSYLKQYGGESATCEEGHEWTVYGAHNGLVPKPHGFDSFDGHHIMVLPYSEAMRMFDLGAQIWNALVWYSSEQKGVKFWGRLLDIAILLRDRAKEGKEENYTTQMDHEVEAMKRDGHRPYSQREDGKSIRVKL